MKTYLGLLTFSSEMLCQSF